MDGPLPCFHCGEPLPPGGPILAELGDDRRPMCCVGCKAVAEFIHDNGLDAFYRHREAPQAELGLKAEATDYSLYDRPATRERYVHKAGHQAEAVIEIGGMYCSACVWLLQNALKQDRAIVDLSVNPATRRAVVRWDIDALPFSELLSSIARVGFKPHPRGAGSDNDTAVAEQRLALRRLIVAAAAGMQVMMFAVALYAGAHYGIEGPIEEFLRLVSLLVCIPIVVYSARPFFTGAWRGVRAGTPGMDLPVAIAIGAAFAASAWTTLAGSGDVYFDSVAMFVLFLSAARYIEMRTRHQAEDLTEALATLLPETVTRLRDGEAEVIDTGRLQSGDVVLIRPGDVIPADGVVLSGALDIDESLLTGEALPVHRDASATVAAGSINRAGNASIRVTLTGAATSLAETARLLERARADRPAAAVLADRVASRFVLGMLAVTALTGLAWLTLDPSRAFEIVLATLVVTCPCALALATPAALAAATSRLARAGFLTVRTRVLDVLAKPATMVFDKTGTLTSGRPAIGDVETFAADMDEAECRAVAAAIETASEHVLARAFAMTGPTPAATDVTVRPGRGVEATVHGRAFRIGRPDWVAAFSGSRVDESPGTSTSVLLGDRQRVVARFGIEDPLRQDAAAAIQTLAALGYDIVLASGDREPAVRAVADALGIERWHASMSPDDKLALAGDLRAGGQPVVMVGDGINDAPVLAGADASIAIDAGTALARASADAIVPGRRLEAVADAARVAHGTRRVIVQNLAWAIAYNLVAVPLAATGMLAPWMAAIGMSASSLLVVGNASRLRHFAAGSAPITAAARCPGSVRAA